MQGEEGILRRLAELAGNADIFSVDAAGPQGLLINIDGYAASMSRLPFMSWSDWGYKSTVASASDVVASGGRPIAIAYSVGATSVDVLEEVAKGVGDASHDVGAKVYKADANKSVADAWIDVAVVGSTNRPVARSGAAPGDVVVQVGYLGYGALAYKIMRSEVSLRDIDEGIIKRIARPRPYVDVAEAISRYAHASSDNSDGWLVTLSNIARSSGVLISLEDVVVDPRLEGLLTSEESVMSWEDYNLAVVVPAGSLDEFLRSCGSLCFVVGKVKEGHGVEFRGKPLEPRGWSWW